MKPAALNQHILRLLPLLFLCIAAISLSGCQSITCVFSNCTNTQSTTTVRPTPPGGGGGGGGGGDPINGNGQGQEFTQQNTAQGPAIVEWWTGDVNSNNQAINCGVFKLPSGQSFTWTHLGHFWEYTSDAVVNAQWDAHVRAYKAKSVNALCTVGSPPS